jgi:hypothetical protein
LVHRRAAHSRTVAGSAAAMGGAHRLTPHSLIERYPRPVEQDPVRAGQAGTGSAGDDASRGGGSGMGDGVGPISRDAHGAVDGRGDVRGLLPNGVAITDCPRCVALSETINRPSPDVRSDARNCGRQSASSQQRSPAIENSTLVEAVRDHPCIDMDHSSPVDASHSLKL